MKRIIYVLLIATLAFTACGKKEVIKSTSMEDLYNEQGVPIKIATIETQNFALQNTYNCLLTGIQETPVYASLSDQIEKINIKIGSQVGKDDVLMEFPITNPAASYKQAEAAYLLSDQTQQRMQSLYNSGGLSKQELDGVETQFKVSKANFESVQRAVKVKAPIAGIVTDVNVKLAQKVNPGELLCTIAQLTQLKGRIWMTEAEIAYAKVGMPLTVEWNGLSYSGKISDIALSMNPSQRAFGVDIVVNNPQRKLKSGINAQVTVSLINKPNSIIIPRHMIQRDEQKNDYVYIVENGLAVKKIVTTGMENNLDMEVLSGINPGDAIITEGFNIVKDQQKVNILD